ncbi:MAG: hypothetical protein PPP58_09625, partial [Natronomonas sp.]
ATGIYGAAAGVSTDLRRSTDRYDPETLFDIGSGGLTAGLSALDDADLEGVTVEILADRPFDNQGANRVRLDADSEAVSAALSPAQGQFVLAVDTGATDAFERDVAPDTEFVVRIEYDGPAEGDERYRFASPADADAFGGGVAGDGERPAFPYLESGESLSASTTVEFVEPSVAFDRVTGGTDRSLPESLRESGESDRGDDPRLLIGNETDSTVSGNTTLAPGTELSVWLQDADAETETTLQRHETTVDADGNWTVSVNGTVGGVGDEFEVFVRANGAVIGSIEAVIVGAHVFESDPEGDETDRTRSEGSGDTGSSIAGSGGSEGSEAGTGIGETTIGDDDEIEEAGGEIGTGSAESTSGGPVPDLAAGPMAVAALVVLVVLLVGWLAARRRRIGE